MKQRRCFLQNRIIWDNFSKDTDLYLLERAGAQDVWGCSGVIGGLFSIAMEGNKKDQEHADCLCFLNCSLNISSSNTVKRPCN